MFDVVLHQPEIPPNTGNVIRLCANAGATLHLVKPLGFQLTDRALARTFLDMFLTPPAPEPLSEVSPGSGAVVVETAAARKIPLVVSLTDFWWLCHRVNLVKPNGVRCGGHVQESVRTT